ncbi:hypothetical protein [Nannocystis bainbridge]|uniref:Outer membrane protein beta-barrel domain-containing protein n=1 Tax=Nannocystis bainbridge TaxID=2995303 RepID=A0ABT5EAG3_9BACT|nr:hypothetical protein [Nannocystis bainbridge]MDC0722845.1 hypothetical protein [Nannocystis bainbridge]
MTPRRCSSVLLLVAAWSCAALASPRALAADGLSGVGGRVDTLVNKQEGLRATGVYLHLSPALGFDVRAPSFRVYGWGVGVGRYWTLRKRLALAFGGFFEHLLWVNTMSSGASWSPSTLNFVRFGPELRVGASNERVFAYGLARVGLDLSISTPAASVARMFLAEAGVGLQGAPGKGRRLLLGVEPTFDVSVPNPWLLFRVRAIVGVRF